MTAQDTARIVRAGYDAFNQQNGDPSSLDPVTTYFAADCEKVDVPSSMTFRGPEGMKQWLTGFITACPDARVEVTKLFATEDHAVVECILRGTHTGPLQGPTGALPPSGRSMRLQACEVHQVRNGLIVSHHTYYDLLGLLQQLGALPAAGQASG
jgi:steroid delta-isomerase-like uncharacterized protein